MVMYEFLEGGGRGHKLMHDNVFYFFIFLFLKGGEGWFVDFSIFEAVGAVSQTCNPSVDCFQHHTPNQTQHRLLFVMSTLQWNLP